MGGIAKDVGRAGLGVMTFGTSELANQALSRNGSGPLGQSFLSWAKNPGIGGSSDPNISGPFSLNQEQLAADQAAIAGLGKSASADITGLGQKQFGDTQSFIGEDAASRAAARAQLADVLTNQFKNTFARTLPNIAENAQAAHLYDTTGYGQEVARQQSYGAQDIASQLAQQGISDIYTQSAQKQAALQALQGTQTQGLGTGLGYQQAGLGRQLSLEDFINQANVAKEIGAQAAPQVGNGKGQTGTLLSGVGSLAPLVGSFYGPAGKAAGQAVKTVVAPPNSALGQTNFA